MTTSSEALEPGGPDTRARPPVTVVVPVYGDLPSLLECIASLRANLDLTRHRVLLVNDCGPDADEIERAVLQEIGDVEGFRYERNAENLGFVGNCNRAVTELDTSDNDVLLLNSDTVTTPGFLEEMLDVLHASDDHGAVCARSNNATIASLPFRLTHGDAPRSVERTREVFHALAPHLPRWYVSPVAMGFCFLTRRTLIRQHGLFDEVFAPGYGEENDYCLRINAAGKSSLIANRALVLHAGSKSFVGARRNTLRAQHQKKLEARYPFYGAATGSFLRWDVHPADRFADVLVPDTRATRVAVDLRGADATTAVTVAEALVGFGARDQPVELEFVVDADLEDAVTALDGVTTVLTAPQDDDIVAVGVFVAGSLDADRFVSASRRYASWIRIDPPGPGAFRWATTATTPSRRTVSETADELADGAVALSPGGDGLGARLRETVRQLEERELTTRIASLEARTRIALTADAVSTRTATDDARELASAREQLGLIRTSRSYRIGDALVRVGKKVLRR
jgi:GT2 family glycosyltransferase